MRAGGPALCRLWDKQMELHHVPRGRSPSKGSCPQAGPQRLDLGPGLSLCSGSPEGSLHGGSKGGQEVPASPAWTVALSPES